MIYLYLRIKALSPSISNVEAVQMYSSHQKKFKSLGSLMACPHCLAVHYKIDKLINSGYLCYNSISHQLRGSFSAKWVKDINLNSTYEFDEFQDLRRNFYENESFLIACGLYESNPYRVDLEIHEQLSGKLVYSDAVQDLNLRRINQACFTFPEKSFKTWNLYVQYLI